MQPVPGYRVTTKFGIKGSNWKACNFHTGVDIAAPKGTPVVAARPGVVRHTLHGTAFGPHQFAIVADDGTADFYAHCTKRPAAGTRVKAGQVVSAVGDLGNVTGPHLHFERHKAHGSWNCSNVTDPAPSLDWTPKEDDDMPLIYKDEADLIAARIWKADIVPSPSGKDSSNPTWAAGSYLKEMLITLRSIDARLKALESKQ